MSTPTQHVVRIDASPEEAWAYLADLRRRPEWDYSLRGVEYKGEENIGLEGSFQKMRGP
ncbi:MAG TPA: SRPBCC family protein, partial [Myxococcota bacterium]|nr:SRPBCC family protein [Myxococcota bacterium]